MLEFVFPEARDELVQIVLASGEQVLAGGSDYFNDGGFPTGIGRLCLPMLRFP
jgi:hypothetical protein